MAPLSPCIAVSALPAWRRDAIRASSVLSGVHACTAGCVHAYKQAVLQRVVQCLHGPGMSPALLCLCRNLDGLAQAFRVFAVDWLGTVSFTPVLRHS